MTEPEAPAGSGVVYRWLAAVAEGATTAQKLWDPLDSNHRLVLVQQWICGPGRGVLGGRIGDDVFGREFADDLRFSPSAAEQMLRDYLDHWQRVYADLEGGPALVAQEDFAGPDLEVVVVTSDDNAGTWEEGTGILCHTFLTRYVDGEWRIAACARRLPIPGWPPREEVIPGLKVDGNQG